ncbi:hypothetical protein BJX63DRAFT_378418 [Aspergillus granulosus]|uniref:Uncharacterized protein n=1 Tax=Aspergillus granulosus TaxID=176169 RepID=A0ABR4I1E2_9EURO
MCSARDGEAERRGDDCKSNGQSGRYLIDRTLNPVQIIVSGKLLRYVSGGYAVRLNESLSGMQNVGQGRRSEGSMLWRENQEGKTGFSFLLHPTRRESCSSRSRNGERGLGGGKIGGMGRTLHKSRREALGRSGQAACLTRRDWDQSQPDNCPPANTTNTAFTRAT